MDGVWCFLEGWCIGLFLVLWVPSSPFLLSVFPFYNGPFFSQEGALVISLVQGPSPLADHLCYSQDTHFPLFKAEAFFDHTFAFFHVPAVLSVWFGLLFQAPFICNIIIISWEGEDINGVLEEHGCVKWFALNALFYGGRKLFRGLHAHIWLQESSFGDRGISQTNPLVFSRIHEPPR